MKDNWERVKPAMKLSHSEINGMAKSYFGRDVVDFNLVSGGLSNSNYQIRMEGTDRPYLLRVYGSSEPTCQKERDVHRLVRKTVPVPEFYYVDSSCRIYEKHFAIMEWVEGIPLNKVMHGGASADIVEAAASAGAVLADIHQYGFDSPGFFGTGLTVKEPLRLGPEMFLSFIEESLFHGVAGSWLGKDLTERLWRFAKENASLLSEEPDRYSLTHSDYNGWNLLMSRDAGEWKTAAVLDWEFAFSATSTVDIGNMLRYEEPGSLFENHFIKGFESRGGRLPKEWRKLAKLEDLIALCDLLNRSSNGPNRVNDLRALVGTTLDQWNKA
ncbi:MAG TPA: aminoglycoside phosphotransferase family protein [Bacillales bacterium]|nr:aminoglycoside phosphotransferase family protein [Bacillales bacterium]